MKTKSNMTVSKLQSEAVTLFRDRGFVKEGDWLNNPRAKEVVSCYAKPVLDFIQDQIDISYSKGREEERKLIYQMAWNIQAIWMEEFIKINSKDSLSSIHFNGGAKALSELLNNLSIQSKEK